MYQISRDFLTSLADKTRILTVEAGKRILEIYETDFSVVQKNDHSPLTVADMAAHEIICSGLAQLTQDIPVLSEESSAIPFTERKQWTRYWLVDPLDGTREFIKRNGEFSVNIALIDHNEPVIGVIYIPVSGISYFAVKGEGAFKCMPDDQPQSIRVKTTTSDKITLTGSRSHGNEMQQAFIERLGDNIEVIAIGSSLKFCLVAEGKVDIYPRFGPTSEWDTAAAQCIVEEAGGKVTDMELNPLRYNLRESLINPDFLVIADESFDWRPYLSD
jgi:3'(2'), 5'-bisphosphate nucleotidase